MIDSFPFDEWSEDIGAFWTFWSESDVGTFVLTALGMLLMVASLIGWMWLEHKKLTAQAAHLRGAAGGGGSAGHGS